MNIGDITSVVTPPKDPIDTDKSILAANEVALKTKFPHDFVVYSLRFGTGQISVGSYTWEIYSACRARFPEFVKSFAKREDTYRTAMETTSIGLGLYPESGGLLPFGCRDDVYFCWKTDGSPESWKVCVIWEYQKGGYEQFDLCFTEFIVSLLTKRIKVDGFKPDWNPKKDIEFIQEVFNG